MAAVCGHAPSIGVWDEHEDKELRQWPHAHALS
jgi:hypothetical protein